ncbi:MAG: energy transducer TonB [Bacteroidetes bacterium HGW-Bacteroidetes-21]|jgi:protein TonB|nr:MAG: energy transducer TonB [Bacteroidetes bacterium HGW-Bacteroidetes-21]
METKKSPKADLEKYRMIFLQTGLIITLAVIFAAFEWQGSSNNENVLGDLETVLVEEEIIPITKQEEIKALPPPPQVVEVLEIVEDDVDVEDVKIEDTEANQHTEVKAVEIQQEEEVDEVINFYVIEDKPEFPGGGEAALLKWIAQNTQYPQIAKDMGIKGKVFIQFIIDKEGNVTNAEVIRGVDPSLDKEALRVVKSMPKWKPGKQRGKPVKVSFQIPINFTLY